MIKLKTVLITLGILLLLFLAFRACTAYVGKKIKGSMQELVKGKQKEFLEGIDFSDGGDYALILDDQKPPLLIDDITVLQDNKDKIELSASWMSYLPGEGRSAYGLRLFFRQYLDRCQTGKEVQHFQYWNYSRTWSAFGI